MKRFLTLLVGLVATSVCYSAPTYTSYFNNTHTYTNSTTAGTNSASRGVFTNSLSAAGFATSGTTNATLTGNLLANGATFTNRVLAFNYGTDAGLSATLSSGATEIYNIGDLAGDSAAYSGGNAYDNFNFGARAGRFATLVDSHDVYNFGFGAGLGSTLTNSSDIYLLGSGAGDSAIITDSSHIYAFGHNAGAALTGASYSEIYLFGNNAQPTLTANQQVFGSGTDNYRFAGSGGIDSIGPVRASSGVFTNGLTAGASTFTGAVGFADGTVTAPSIAWTADQDGTGSGFYRVAADGIGVALNGTATHRFWSSGSLSLSVNTGQLIFGTDTTLSRDGAASTLQGGADSATATAFTFKGPDGTGTDKVGGALQLGGGKSTGTAASGAVILHTANSAGASGSSLNTNTERFHAPAKWVTLTSATATTIFTIPVPATNYVGLTATVTVYATDGTDHQSKTSVITCDAINKAGTITETLTQVDNTTAASSGTLTATYDSVDAGSNVVGIRVAADSSLTETVLRAKIVITAINSNGAATVTEF